MTELSGQVILGEENVIVVPDGDRYSFNRKACES